MFCSQCGTNNDATAAHCVHCGTRLTATPIPAPPPPPMMTGYPAGYATESIPNYMVQSILVTLCCCLPMGIVCIIKASKVNQLVAMGDYQGAIQASEENKKLLWIGAGVGLVFSVIYIILKIAGANN